MIGSPQPADVTPMVVSAQRKTRAQLSLFGIFLAANALLALVAYLVFPLEQIGASQVAPASPTSSLPAWGLGLATAGIVVVLYGLLGLAGYWLSGRLGLPGVFRPRAGRREWVLTPMLLGLVMGVVITLIDRGAAATDPTWAGFAHPAFPFSILASATAGIGEEILFRLFVLSLWAFLANLVLGRFGLTGLALWIGNVMAALAFGASHLPAAMLLTGASSASELPALVLGELLLLNGVIALVAGQQFIRAGLVAAIGVHFWADLVWHVLWPLLGSLS